MPGTVRSDSVLYIIEHPLCATAHSTRHAQQAPPSQAAPRGSRKACLAGLPFSSAAIFTHCRTVWPQCQTHCAATTRIFLRSFSL